MIRPVPDVHTGRGLILQHALPRPSHVPETHPVLLVGGHQQPRLHRVELDGVEGVGVTSDHDGVGGRREPHVEEQDPAIAAGRGEDVSLVREHISILTFLTHSKGIKRKT